MSGRQTHFYGWRMSHSSCYRRHHLDSHHVESCKFLQQIGFSIDDTSKRGSGRQDVCVGAGGVDFRLEFKTGDAPSTEAQERFHREWRGRKIVILRSLEETKEWGLRTLHELRRSQTPLLVAASPRVDGRYRGQTEKE